MAIVHRPAPFLPLPCSSDTRPRSPFLGVTSRDQSNTRARNLPRMCGEIRSSRSVSKVWLGIRCLNGLTWTRRSRPLASKMYKRSVTCPVFCLLIVLDRILLLPQTCTTYAYYGRSLGDSITTFADWWTGICVLIGDLVSESTESRWRLN